MLSFSKSISRPRHALSHQNTRPLFKFGGETALPNSLAGQFFLNRLLLNVAYNRNHTYAHTVRQLKQGSWTPGNSSRIAIGLASILAVLGIFMATYIALLP